MNEHLAWVSGFYISVLDFIILYVISHALMKKYIIVEKQHVLACIIFATVTRLGFYFLNPFVAQIITHMLAILLMNRILKRVSGNDMILIYVMWIMTMGVIQPIFLTLAEFSPLSESASFPITQTLTLLIVIILSKMFKWYRVFHTIRSNWILKLILFIMFLIVITLISIWNFSPNGTFLFTIMTIFSAIALFPIFVQVYQKVAGIISPEELRTNLFVTAVDMVEEPNPKIHYQIYAELAKQYSVDIDSLPVDKKRYEYTDRMNEKITQLIQERVKSSRKELKVDSEIMYDSAYKDMNFEYVEEWLSILLDHALLTATSNPIYIHLFSMKDNFSLEVAGEHMIGNWKAVEKSFKQDQSKEDDGLNIKLHLLYNQVIQLGGKLIIKPSYMLEHKCHYLQISIGIEKEDDLS